MLDFILNFIHDHLAAMSLILPALGVILVYLGVEYMDRYYLRDEWPTTTITEADIQAAIADDPNVEIKDDNS